MASKKTPRSKMGFFSVREKPSGNYGVEFCDAGRRFWLGTYPTAHEAARAYDVAVWHPGRPKKDLNFPEIKTRADAELLVPGGIDMEEMPPKKRKKTKKRPAIVVSLGDSDEAAMARFAREHPEYVQAEQEFFWKHDAEQKKKKGVKKEDEAGPSTVIPVESSEEEWGDSEEEDEGCDDPDKDGF